MKKQVWLRLLLGGLLGAALAPVLMLLFGSYKVQAQTVAPLWAQILVSLVDPRMAVAFGSAGLAALVQSLLGGLFGAIVALATLPFADDGKELVLQSLAHFLATALSFSALLWVCRWVTIPQVILMWVGLLALLYTLIWLGRWIGWYGEVVQLRTLLGLDPGPSPLKWKETLPYLPFVLLVCDLLPALLWWIDRTFVVDLPVFSGLLYPYLFLPVVGFLSGVSLGKRQGVCWLYPLACALCYLPMVFLLFNSSALFHCLMIAVPAFTGNVLGWLYRRAVPKRS